MTRFKRALLASLIAVCLTGLFLFLQASFAAQIELNPIAFSLGKFEVRWYGLLIGLTILIGFPWAVKRATQQNILPDRAESVLWWSIVGGAVGARFLYVVQNFAFYQLHSQQILEVFDGGLSIHGMIAGGLIAGYLLGYGLAPRYQVVNQYTSEARVTDTVSLINRWWVPATAVILLAVGTPLSIIMWQGLA